MGIKKKCTTVFSFIVAFCCPLLEGDVCPLDIAPTNNLKLTFSRNSAMSKYRVSPLFSERHINIYEVYAAAFSAIAYSGHALADGIDMRKDEVRHFTSQLRDDVSYRIPYCIEGVSLTNMSIRVFGFSSYPPLSTNKFECSMVTFWEHDKFLYALYVNNRYDNVGMSIQQCGGTRDFLENAVAHPYLNKNESKSNKSST